MLCSALTAFAAALLCGSAFGAPANARNGDSKRALTIDVDVAVIGGGASGTYSAIQLKDAGKSVVVIEQKGRLGGHTETYIDPSNQKPVNIGVLSYSDIPVVREFFKRLNVATSGYFLGQQSVTYNFRTGAPVNSTYSAADTGIALGNYFQQLAKYPQLDDGFFLPDPVPNDLYMPFGDFVKKYNLQAAVLTIFQITQAYGDILKLPTVEVMRFFGLTVLGYLQGAALTAASGDNSQLYQHATTELNAANALLLDSTVIAADRLTKGPVVLTVRTATGVKIVTAKKLLITIPPTISNLAPFILTPAEGALFSQFSFLGYYTCLLENTGIPSDLIVSNLGANTPYNLPPLPSTYAFLTTADGELHDAFYGTPFNTVLSDDVVKANIISELKRVQAANPGVLQQTEPKVVDFSSHTPFNLFVDSDAVKNGFYKKLYALQGQTKTFWTGATWRSQDSSAVWKFSNQTVLPALLASL